MHSQKCFIIIAPIASCLVKNWLLITEAYCVEWIKTLEFWVKIKEHDSLLLDDSGGGCFPSTASVTMEDGKSVAMSELQTGDKVQTGRDIDL